jgi:hypothetical protein
LSNSIWGARFTTIALAGHSDCVYGSWDRNGPISENTGSIPTANGVRTYVSGGNGKRVGCMCQCRRQSGLAATNGSFSQLASSPPNPIAVRRDVETPKPAHVHAKRNLLQIDRRWILAVALIALCGLGWGVSYYAVMGKRTSGGAEKQHTVAEQSTVKEAIH